MERRNWGSTTPKALAVLKKYGPFVDKSGFALRQWEEKLGKRPREVRFWEKKGWILRDTKKTKTYEVCLGDLPERLMREVNEEVALLEIQAEINEGMTPSDAALVIQPPNPPTAEDVAMALLNELIKKLDDETVHASHLVEINDLKDKLHHAIEKYNNLHRKYEELQDEAVQVRRILDQKLIENRDLTARLQEYAGRIPGRVSNRLAQITEQLSGGKE